jgi:hypothetical protein
MTLICSPIPMRWSAAPFMQIAPDPRAPAMLEVSSRASCVRAAAHGAGAAFIWRQGRQMFGVLSVNQDG